MKGERELWLGRLSPKHAKDWQKANGGGKMRPGKRSGMVEVQWLEEVPTPKFESGRMRMWRDTRTSDLVPSKAIHHTSVEMRKVVRDDGKLFWVHDYRNEQYFDDISRIYFPSDTS